MRLAAITRILNEADIVEAFTRHTASAVDHHIFLDNGSHDGTVEILRALRDEGGRIDLLQVGTATFCEHLHNTLLYRFASSAQADWVCCLDADEFLRFDAAGADGRFLRQALEAVPAEQEAVSVPLINHHTTPRDDAAELLVPRRIRHRVRVPDGVPKVFVRGRLAEAQILAGNHVALIGERPARMAPLAGASLAHYPSRCGGVQMLAKAVIGRLKVLAGGAEAGADTSGHYTVFLDLMRDNPGLLLGDANFMSGANAGVDLVDDPLPYLGGPLTHTRPIDPNLHAVRALAHAGEALARAHGRLLDENTALRSQVRLWATELRRL